MYKLVENELKQKVIRILNALLFVQMLGKHNGESAQLPVVDLTFKQIEHLAWNLESIKRLS